MLFQTPVFLIIANNTHNLHLWHINNQSFVVLLWVYYHYFHFNSCFSISVPLRRGGWNIYTYQTYPLPCCRKSVFRTSLESPRNRYLPHGLTHQLVHLLFFRLLWWIFIFWVAVVLHHLEWYSLYGRIWLFFVVRRKKVGLVMLGVFQQQGNLHLIRS